MTPLSTAEHRRRHDQCAERPTAFYLPFTAGLLTVSLLAIAAFLASAVLGAVLSAVLLVAGLLVTTLRVSSLRVDSLLGGLVLHRVEDADDVLTPGEGDS